MWAGKARKKVKRGNRGVGIGKSVSKYVCVQRLL